MSNRKTVRATDPNFESQVMAWFEESNEELSIDQGDSDEKQWPDENENDVIENHHTSEEEEEEEEEEGEDFDKENEEQPNQNYFYGKNKITRWNKNCPVNSRTRSHNIVKIRVPGPQSSAKNCKTQLETLRCFLDEEIITLIVKYTNIYINEVKDKYSRARDAKLTNNEEVLGLIGILYLAGLLQSGRQHILQMWDNSKGLGVEAIYLTMGINRFRFLMRCLRFDNIIDRNERKKTDNLAAIRKIFEMFVLKFKSMFIPSQYLTLDEQLIAFRGNCPFRTYIPSKPAKYGIKIFALVDCKSIYTCNLEIYCGKQPAGPHSTSWKNYDLVMRMIAHITGTGRNVSMDNWFTSVPLAVDLLQMKTTIIGTLRKNKPDIPPQFINATHREVYSSLFGFHKMCTLVSYVPKRKKVVLLLSTMHHDCAIDNDTGDLKKPEIITDYNNTNYGVDMLDKMCSHYDVSRNSRRWPLTIFFNLLNIAAINGMCIYKTKSINKIDRKSDLQTIGYELITPLLRKRLESDNIATNIKEHIRKLLNIEPEILAEIQPNTSTVGKCFYCGRQKNKSTRKHCSKCGKWVCPAHLRHICPKCNEED
nr:piggyBac transposable element-derived protein 4-like [Onthophagus taurus]